MGHALPHPWVGKTVTQTEDLIIMQRCFEENYPQNSMGLHTGRDRLGFNLEDQERLGWMLKEDFLTKTSDCQALGEGRDELAEHRDF